MNNIGRYLFGFIVLNLIGFSIHAIASTNIRSIQKQLANLEASTGGRLGVAALNTGNNQPILYRGNEYFPMGCTSKVIGVAAILKKNMNNDLLLQERVMYKKNDLTNWTPITEKHLKDGMTIAELCAAAISYSDNTAMNLLTKKLGGPAGLNSFARSIQDQHFHLDHWWPDEALATPYSREDATTPASMEKSLRKIILGDVLEKSKREMLITWMKENTTGNDSIRAGVPKGWVVGDKTGAGFYYGTTNDIAVVWPTKCAPIVIAIFYSSNKKDAPKRKDIIAAATRILINYYAKTDECLKNSEPTLTFCNLTPI